MTLGLSCDRGILKLNDIRCVEDIFLILANSFIPNV